MAVDDERHGAIIGVHLNSPFHGLVCCDPNSALLLMGFWTVLGASAVSSQAATVLTDF